VYVATLYGHQSEVGGLLYRWLPDVLCRRLALCQHQLTAAAPVLPCLDQAASWRLRRIVARSN